jgi:hypothetical protein
MNPDWDEVQRGIAAMQAIAPVLDSLEEEVNKAGPVDLMQAYFIALGALREVGMEKATLEKFVAVLIADRTHHAVGDPNG